MHDAYGLLCLKRKLLRKYPNSMGPCALSINYTFISPLDEFKCYL